MNNRRGEPLIAKGFTKVDQDTQAELLKSNELAILENMVLDYPGLRYVPKKRPGYAQFNANATSANILAIYDVADEAGTNYLLAVHNYGTSPIYSKLVKSSAGTGAYSDVETGLTPSAIARITPLGEGRYLVTNGSDAPFIISGTAFANSESLKITEPDMQGVTAVSSVGGDLTGFTCYAYIVVYVTSTGDLSDISQPVFCQLTTNGYQTITLSNLPVSSDTRVVSRKIYRTSGNGETYYLLTTLDNTLTSYVDDSADTGLDMSESVTLMSNPSTIKFPLMHKDRVWGGYIKRSRRHDIQLPYANFTLTPNATGGTVTDGIHKVKYCYVNKEGLRSELTPYQQCTVSGGGSGSITVNLVAFPLIGANRYNKNSDIKEIEFYMTKSGGSTYYYAGTYVIGDSTDTTDIVMSDGSLSATYPNGLATAAATYEVTYKNWVIFSDVSNYQQIPAINFIPVAPDDGDEITGIFDNVDGVLIFKKNSICKIYTTDSPSNWQVKVMVDNIGADTVLGVGQAGQAFYFVKNNRPYRYSNGVLELINDGIQKTFDTITGYYGVTHSTKKNWVIFSVLISSAYYFLVYDEKLRTWYTFTVTKSFSVAEKKIGATTGYILFGDDNYICSMSDGLFYDTQSGSNVEILCKLRTKTFVVSDGISEIRARKIWVNYKADYLAGGTNTLQHTIYNPDTALSRYLTETNTAQAYKRFEKNTDIMTGSLKRAQKIYYEVAGYGILEFLAFKLVYNVLPQRLYQ